MTEMIDQNTAAENETIKAAADKPETKKKKKGRKKKILKRIIWTVILLLVLGVALWSVYSKLQAEYRITYDSYTATTGSISNSLSFTGSMQLIIEKIAECKEAGMGFEETVDAVNEYYKHTKILFLLESLGNLSKNGRVNPAVAKVASFLGIRFLGKASEEGTIQQASIARGAKKAFATLYNEILKMGYNGGKMRLSHCLNPDQAHKMKEELLVKFPGADIVVDNCTGLCSYYAERGGMIVCFEIKD